MGFLAGVWRLLGAEDDDIEREGIVEYPAAPSSDEFMPRDGMVDTRDPDGGVISMPEPAITTIFVVRPERDDTGENLFHVKQYARFLLTRQALVLDVNELAAEDVNTAMRVVDYLSGVVEAVDGTVWEVTKNIFIFAPNGVKLAGDPLKQVKVM